MIRAIDDGDPAPLDAVLATLAPTGDARWSLAIPGDWMQGRTAYGGIGAALALAAARALVPDAGPLRCAQLSFVGPLGGRATAEARVIRRSKSSRFVAVDLVADGADEVATHALFTFSPARDSAVAHDALSMPAVPDPDTLEPVGPHPMRPAFTHHFDMRPVDGPRFAYGEDTADYATWVRFARRPDAPADIALLALGDALPPAALRLMRTMAPVSSMNWTVQMLADAPVTDDGWWLLRTRSDHVADGYAMQHMTLWSRSGEPVMTGYQTVALFG